MDFHLLDFPFVGFLLVCFHFRFLLLVDWFGRFDGLPVDWSAALLGIASFGNVGMRFIFVWWFVFCWVVVEVVLLGLCLDDIIWFCFDDLCVCVACFWMVIW